MSAAVPIVVITRPAEAGPSLARALERHGLRTWHVTPTVVTARGGSAELLRAMATTPPGLAGRRPSDSTGRVLYRRCAGRGARTAGHRHVGGGVNADVVASAPIVETLAADLARHFATSSGGS
ncbi:MAG: hypothetical protein JJE40_15565 [Vicinamibacteria bacterium]|nr:hypothetical protein [Vicinamibacteria bacterium]